MSEKKTIHAILDPMSFPIRRRETAVFYHDAVSAVEQFAKQETASLQARVSELEEDRKRWFDLYSNLAVKQQNTLIDRIAELEKENEKLMGLLEISIKKANNHATSFDPDKANPEAAWQSYLTSHGLNSKQ